MPTIHAIVLGIVQGLSEFLPISSSGHLILVPELFHWTELTHNESLNKTFDVALHMGTFIGAFVYFRHELARYVVAAIRSLRRRSITTTDERMAWLLLLSAVPGAVAGALLEKPIENALGDPVLIGVMFVVMALVLYAADQLANRRVEDDWQLRDAAIMGIAQALALQPGVSRSGVTISAGRWLGFDRDSATRISFLMSLPIIFGAGMFKALKLGTGAGIPSSYYGAFFWGFVAAGVSGWLAIWGLLRFLRTHSFTPFVIYRVAVGILVIVIFGTGLR